MDYFLVKRNGLTIYLTLVALDCGNIIIVDLFFEFIILTLKIDILFF